MKRVIIFLLIVSSTSCKNEKIKPKYNIICGFETDRCGCPREIIISNHTVKFRKVDAGKESIFDESLSQDELNEIYQNIDFETFKTLTNYGFGGGAEYIRIEVENESHLIMNWSLEEFKGKNAKIDRLIDLLKSHRDKLILKYVQR